MVAAQTEDYGTITAQSTLALTLSLESHSQACRAKMGSWTNGAVEEHCKRRGSPMGPLFDRLTRPFPAKNASIIICTLLRHSLPLVAQS
jgi:hypothetical protein